MEKMSLIYQRFGLMEGSDLVITEDDLSQLKRDFPHMDLPTKVNLSAYKFSFRDLIEEMKTKGYRVLVGLDTFINGVSTNVVVIAEFSSRSKLKKDFFEMASKAGLNFQSEEVYVEM